MTSTLQAVLDQARLPLNDTDKARYEDEDMRKHLCHALLTLWRRRPDLFMGSFGSPPTLALALGDTFPLDDAYVQPVADYVTARSESVDAEFTESGRAASFFQLFAGAAGG